MGVMNQFVGIRVDQRNQEEEEEEEEEKESKEQNLNTGKT